MTTIVLNKAKFGMGWVVFPNAPAVKNKEKNALYTHTLVKNMNGSKITYEQGGRDGNPIRATRGV